MPEGPQSGKGKGEQDEDFGTGMVRSGSEGSMSRTRNPLTDLIDTERTFMDRMEVVVKVSRIRVTINTKRSSSSFSIPTTSESSRSVVSK